MPSLRVAGFVAEEVGAHVLDDVEVSVLVVVDLLEVGFAVVVGVRRVVGVLRVGEMVVGDVAALVEQAALEREELLARAGGRGRDASVGELFAADGAAFAREDARVLDVDEVRSLRPRSGPDWRRRGP